MKYTHRFKLRDLTFTTQKYNDSSGEVYTTTTIYFSGEREVWSQVLAGTLNPEDLRRWADELEEFNKE